MTDLADVLLGDPNDGAGRTPTLRMGVVTQASPLRARVGSSTVDAPCTALASYGPIVGDVVEVLVLDGDRIVIGVAGPQPARSFIPVRRGGGVVDVLGTGGVAVGWYTLADGLCKFSIVYAFGASGSGAVANAGVTTFDAPAPFGAANGSFVHVGSGTAVQGGARAMFQVVRDGASNGFQLYGPSQYTNLVPAGANFLDEWRFSGEYRI